VTTQRPHERFARGHDFIGTEHILLGLVAEAEGVGATDARAGNDPSWGLVASGG